MKDTMFGKTASFGAAVAFSLSLPLAPIAPASVTPPTAPDLSMLDLSRMRDNPRDTTPPPEVPSDSDLEGGFVSLTFDDGWTSSYTEAFPILEDEGVNGTFYIVTDRIGQQGFMTEGELMEIYRGGNEIGAHTRTHADLTELSGSALRNEMVGSKNDLLDMGIGSISSFAYPFGAWDEEVLDLARDNFSNARTVGGAFNTDADDRYLIESVSIKEDTSVAEVKDMIDEAREKNLWLVLVFHQIDAPENAGFTTSSGDLRAIIDYIQESNLPIRTISQGAMMMQE